MKFQSPRWAFIFFSILSQAADDPNSCLADQLRRTLGSLPESLRTERGYQAFPNMSSWPETLKNEIGSSKIFALNEGSVYRIQPANGEPWILKASRDGVQESFVLEMLRVFCKGSNNCGLRFPQPRYHGYQVDPRTDIQKHFVSYPDTQGRTLNAILGDPQTTPEVKRALREKYDHVIRDIEWIFEAEHPQRIVPTKEYFPHIPRDELHLDGLRILEFYVNPVTKIDLVEKQGGTFPKQGLAYQGMVPVIIKSDNIIVDPKTLEFTLIDPY